MKNRRGVEGGGVEAWRRILVFWSEFFRSSAFSGK